MQIRLYIDEDAMSRLLINGLVARGINVTTVDKECRTGIDDASQLEFAILKERVLYTCNII